MSEDSTFGKQNTDTPRYSAPAPQNEPTPHNTTGQNPKAHDATTQTQGSTPQSATPQDHAQRTQGVDTATHQHSQGCEEPVLYQPVNAEEAEENAVESAAADCTEVTRVFAVEPADSSLAHSAAEAEDAEPTRYLAPVRITEPPSGTTGQQRHSTGSGTHPHAASPPVQHPQQPTYYAPEYDPVPYAQMPPQYIPAVPVVPVIPVMQTAVAPVALQPGPSQSVEKSQRALQRTLWLRLVVLVIISCIEAPIIARYTREMALAYGVIAALYTIVQMWPLLRPPRTHSDASVYIVWGIFSMISFVGVGLLLAPITFLLLILDWGGVSLYLDPMVVLGALGVLWLLEITLLSVTFYRLGNLRVKLARQVPLLNYLGAHGQYGVY